VKADNKREVFITGDRAKKKNSAKIRKNDQPPIQPRTRGDMKHVTNANEIKQ